MTGLCPHCGRSLVPDKEVERDGWRITSWGQCWYEGRLLNLTPSRGLLLYGMAAVDGPISRIALLARISESEKDNLLAVQLSHLRRSLRAQDVPIPFYTLGNSGKMIWAGAQ